MSVVNMRINKEILKKLKPCKIRWENYLTHYSEFDGTFEEFIDLDNISYNDKFWVARRVLNKNQLVNFAILCAQSVSSIYENKYLNDKRVSDLIGFMITIDDYTNLTNNQQLKLKELRHSAHFAADAAAADYATYSANAATNAAYSAEMYSVRENQKNLNLTFLKVVASL